MMHFANLQEAEAALEPFHPSRIARHAYTTEHIQQFMEYVGNPQDVPKSIHIAGTSGKTSTAYYAAALLQQAGKRVGLLTSPHAETINERVQIDLTPLDERTFCDELALFLDIVSKSGLTLTHAELMYGFAYWEFARQRVDYIVVEVGMGGLLDATNVITRPGKMCIITDIGMDHTNVLGETIEEIASHKAGIIHLHNTVFCYDQGDAVMEAVRRACQQKQADLHMVDPGLPADVTFLPLFQRRNFTLAVHAVQFILGRDGSGQLSGEALDAAAHVRIPSRMELLQLGGKTVVLDGAHNPQKLHALVESVADLFPGEPIALLVGFTGGRGRKIEELVRELGLLHPSQVFVTALTGHSPNGTSRIAPEEVVTALEAAGMKATYIQDQRQALDAVLRSPAPVALITGSLYLVSELKPLLSGSAMRP